MTTVEAAAAPKRERWTAQWKELFEEVIDGGLCTGCSGCVIACPHDVIGYDDKNGVYKPSHLEGNKGDWKAIPAVATNKEEVLKGAGSRYTYSANPMAVFEARERGSSRLALVGMGCQTSSPPVMWHRKVGKAGKPFVFTIG